MFNENDMTDLLNAVRQWVCDSESNKVMASKAKLLAQTMLDYQKTQESENDN